VGAIKPISRGKIVTILGWVFVAAFFLAIAYFLLAALILEGMWTGVDW